MPNRFHNGAEASALVFLQDSLDLWSQIRNTTFRKHTASIWRGGIFPLNNDVEAAFSFAPFGELACGREYRTKKVFHGKDFASFASHGCSTSLRKFAMRDCPIGENKAKNPVSCLCSKTNSSQIQFLHYKFTLKQFFLAIETRRAALCRRNSNHLNKTRL